MTRKRIAILGSTGSIGINTLKVIEAFPDKFKVVALTACNNVRLLEKQIRQFKPEYVAVGQNRINDLRKRTSLSSRQIFDVTTQIEELVSLKCVDVVVLAIRGSIALWPFLAAVRSGKVIAPANKEAIVMAGHIIMKEAKRHRATIVPVDSEQSAIFQCLQGVDRQDVRKIYLTASGGPLKDVRRTKFDTLSVKQILAHPRWKMGKKITVDSATLMNKGLEIIEARWLFDMPIKNIDVVIHPEAIIHSMIALKDGSILAQLSTTDMRIPIQVALGFPRRLESKLPALDLFKVGPLTFEKPDEKKFPALSLCREVGRKEGTLPGVLNAANEVAVEAFLRGALSFTGIYRTVEKVVRKHDNVASADLKEIQSADSWARREARETIKN